jgi:hypothetical protein
MMNVIEREIQKIQAEIAALASVRDRLVLMLKTSQDVATEPKKRGRKPKKVGLPSAAPPASEANHV